MRRSALFAAGIAAVLGLAGCVIAPLPPSSTFAAGPGESVVIAPMAPPPPITETVLVAPAPGYIWIGGYWSWVGGRHVWTRGYWSAPRPGYRWAPRHWEHGAGGWHQRGGHWVR